MKNEGKEKKKRVMRFQPRRHNKKKEKKRKIYPKKDKKEKEQSSPSVWSIQNRRSCSSWSSLSLSLHLI